MYWWGQEPALWRGKEADKAVLVSPPEAKNLEKSSKSLRPFQKGRQVSKRVKQRATNLFTYNVSKGGHPHETSHSLSLYPPAAPPKKYRPPEFPSAAKAEPRAQTTPCSPGAPAYECFEPVLLLLLF